MDKLLLFLVTIAKPDYEQIVSFLAITLSLLFACPRFPLYVDGKVPNSLPTDGLNDTLNGRSRLTGKDTAIIVPKDIIPTLSVFTPHAGKATGIGVITYNT